MAAQGVTCLQAAKCGLEGSTGETNRSQHKAVCTLGTAPPPQGSAKLGTPCAGRSTKMGACGLNAGPPAPGLPRPHLLQTRRSWAEHTPQEVCLPRDTSVPSVHPSGSGGPGDSRPWHTSHTAETTQW